MFASFKFTGIWLFYGMSDETPFSVYPQQF